MYAYQPVLGDDTMKAITRPILRLARPEGIRKQASTGFSVRIMAVSPRGVSRVILFFLVPWIVVSDGTESQLTADSYAFYSTIYRNRSDFAQGEVIAIASHPADFPPPPACAPKTRTSEDANMLENAKRQVPAGLLWQERFEFGRSYLLIPPSEVNEAIDCLVSRARGSASPKCVRYKDVQTVRFLSIPAFNLDHTRALVSISKVCGGLCGGGGTLVLALRDGRWVQEPNAFAMCTWVY